MPNEAKLLKQPSIQSTFHPKHPCHNPHGRAAPKVIIAQLEEKHKDKSDSEIEQLNHRKAQFEILRTLITRKVDKISLFAKDFAKTKEKGEGPTINYLDFSSATYIDRNWQPKAIDVQPVEKAKELEEKKWGPIIVIM